MAPTLHSWLGNPQTQEELMKGAALLTALASLLLLGACTAMINDIPSAGEVVHAMVRGCREAIQGFSGLGG